MFKILTVGILIFAAPLAAQAERSAVKPISYYMAHESELRQIMRACHDSAAYANTATCANVEAAAAGLSAQRNNPDLTSLLNDPRYWSMNPVARDGFLTNCQQGKVRDVALCRAVGQSALQEIRR